MALLYRGMLCSLCRAPLDVDGALFATSGVFLPREDPLHRHCDAVMHWPCYAAWPERARFARAYVDMWAGGEEGNLYWAKVLLDDRVFVERSLQNSGVWVCLYETGTRYSVMVEAWEDWLAGGSAEEASWHAVERAALGEARARLRAALPTAAALEAAVDPERRRRAEAEWARQREEQEARVRYEAAVREMAARAALEGLTCPQCRAVLQDFKVSYRARKRLYLQCRRCGHRFGPEGPVSE
jgi:hypothetical protein